jgi:uncharacterized secreted protein with C-terminal beta-propeller domain
MKTAQKIVMSLSAVIVIAAIVLTAIAPPAAGERISSDGRIFSLSRIDTVSIQDRQTDLNNLPAVGNKETLLKLLRERGALYDGSVRNNDRIQRERGLEFSATADAAAPGAPVPGGGEAGNSGSGSSYSSTNEQVEGVSEGDIVKTDGRYLYALANDVFRIIEVNGADMKIVSTIRFDGIWGAEFYLMGDKIAVVGQKHVPWNWPLTGREADGVIMDMMWHGSNFTVLTVYDITDRANPVETRRVEMEGWSIATRVIGNTVYLITNKHVWSIPYEHADSEFILPCILDTAVSDDAAPIGLDRVYYLPGSEDASYLLIGALDITKNDPFEPAAYLGAGHVVYMSRDNLYIVKTRWEWERNLAARGDDTLDIAVSNRDGTTYTDILRFAIDGTRVTYTGMGSVNGMPINQYSMDEYNGYFRIATTDWQAGTLVTVFNSSMRLAGQTEYMAPGEWMFSMRFMGDMGYVVTFEMVDPLFTIDLSDPYNPIVLGELKIPGFSQYLHPVGKGLLMGIGRDTEEIYDADGNVVNFRDTGLKISLFDVSDPYDPLEIDVLRLGQGWTEVAHNPRALMVDTTRGMYGFTFESWDTNWTSMLAMIVRVDGGKLSVAADLPVTGTWNSRLSFIGNTLYLTYQNGVSAYDYNAFHLMGTLRF